MVKVTLIFTIKIFSGCAVSDVISNYVPKE